MNMNWERVRLQLHFRQLYEAFGALDAELLIVDAFHAEMTKWNKEQAKLHQARDELLSG